MLKKILLGALLFTLGFQSIGASPAAPAPIPRGLNPRSSFDLIRRVDPVISIEAPNCRILNVGQQPTAGTVCLIVDGSNLKVVYSNVPGYYFKEVHVWIGPNPPTGTAPGQFPYTSNNGFCSIAPDKGSAACMIPLTVFNVPDLCNTQWYIATHAALQGVSDSSVEQTGWGDGTCIKSGCSPWATYWQFRFICTTPTPTPTPTPPPTDCEGTGYGYVAGKVTTFQDLGLGSQWGWVITATVPQSLSGKIYVGAGNNDISKAIDAGTIDITFLAGVLKITYTTTSKYDLGTTHVYVGLQNPKSAAPGKLGFQHSNPGTADTSDQYTFTVTSQDSNGVTMSYLATSGTTVYIVIHAEIHCAV